LKKSESSVQAYEGMNKFWTEFKNAYISYRNNTYSLENLLKDLKPLQDEVAKLNKSKETFDKLQERLKVDYQKTFDE
jgi:uncharacterized Fe-S cluster-containing protein